MQSIATVSQLAEACSLAGISHSIRALCAFCTLVPAHHMLCRIWTNESTLTLTLTMFIIDNEPDNQHHQWISQSSPECHPDFRTSFSEIMNEILLFPGVDPYNSKQKMARGTQRHLDLWRYDVIHSLFHICFKNMCLRQLLVPMGCKPYFGQRALLG